MGVIEMKREDLPLVTPERRSHDGRGRGDGAGEIGGVT